MTARGDYLIDARARVRPLEISALNPLFARASVTACVWADRLIDTLARCWSSEIDPMGVKVDARPDGALVRCPRCRRGRLLWRHSGYEAIRVGFREFLKVHGRCRGSAVRKGAPVHHVPATEGV